MRLIIPDNGDLISYLNVVAVPHFTAGAPEALDIVTPLVCVVAVLLTDFTIVFRLLINQPGIEISGKGE